ASPLRIADEAARLAFLLRRLELRGQRLGLIRIAEHAAPLTGRRAQLRENLCFGEPVVAHRLGNAIDETNARIQRVVAEPAALAHAAQDELDARLGRKIVRSDGPRRQTKQS